MKRNKNSLNKTSTLLVKNSRYIDPLSDFGFKRLFGSEPDKEIMIEFLNALFEGEKEIIDLVYSPTEYAGDTEEMRKVFFDLTCTDAEGGKFIIEMQRGEQNYFSDRAVYYLSRLVHEQFRKGETDWKSRGLKGVYLIGLLDFILKGNKTGRYLHNVALTNTDTGELFYRKLGYKFIELPNFVKTEAELVTNLDKWLFLLKNLSRLEKIPAVLNKRIFQRVFKIAEVSKLTKEERVMYSASLKAKMDYEGSIAFAADNAFEKGIEQGRYEETLEIAREMKKDGEPIVKISKYTKLTIQEINEL